MLHTDHITKEIITGDIAYFKFNKSTTPYKIFWLQIDDGKGGFCKGNVIKEKALQEGANIRLFGSWRIDPKFPQYEKQFFFSSYEIISMDGQREISLGEIFASIGNKIISYKFHDPKQNSISLHVKKQLNDRIKQSSPDEKDFYFLTAFLDRHIYDDYCQWFRKRHRQFKKELLSCWSEDENSGLILQAIADIRKFIDDKEIIKRLRAKNKYMDKLMSDLPGNFMSSLAGR